MFRTVIYFALALVMSSAVVDAALSHAHARRPAVAARCGNSVPGSRCIAAVEKP